MAIVLWRSVEINPMSNTPAKAANTDDRKAQPPITPAVHAPAVHAPAPASAPVQAKPVEMPAPKPVEVKK